MPAEKKLTARDTKHVADLAKISLTEAETAKFTAQLNDILAYFAKLDEIDTEGIDPTYHALPLTNVFREDVVEPSLPVEEALENAPDAKDGFIKAPRIH